MNTPTLKTASGSSFYAMGLGLAQSKRLFTVAEGIPQLEALESAYSLIGCSERQLRNLAMGSSDPNGDTARLASFALEAAMAVIDSLVCSLERHGFDGGDI